MATRTEKQRTDSTHARDDDEYLAADAVLDSSEFDEAWHWIEIRRALLQNLVARCLELQQRVGRGAD